MSAVESEPPTIDLRTRKFDPSMLTEPLQYMLYFRRDDPSESHLEVYVDGIGCIEGRLANMNGKRVALMDEFAIHEELQGKGLGKRFFMGFVAMAKAEGATELWSESVSEPALHLRAKLLGENCLKFYDDARPEAGFLPMTLEQAMDSNARLDAWEDEHGTEAEQGYLGVFVDLDQVDTAGWELPSLRSNIGQMLVNGVPTQRYMDVALENR